MVKRLEKVVYVAEDGSEHATEKDARLHDATQSWHRLNDELRTCMNIALAGTRWPQAYRDVAANIVMNNAQELLPALKVVSRAQRIYEAIEKEQLL